MILSPHVCRVPCKFSCYSCRRSELKFSMCIEMKPTEDMWGGIPSSLATVTHDSLLAFASHASGLNIGQCPWCTIPWASQALFQCQGGAEHLCSWQYLHIWNGTSTTLFPASSTQDCSNRLVTFVRGCANRNVVMFWRGEERNMDLLLGVPTTPHGTAWAGEAATWYCFGQ